MANKGQSFATLFQGPDAEKSACGVGFIVHSKGHESRDLLMKAQVMSSRMEHRGACSCDNLTGDGAGVMTSIPHKLFQRKVQQEANITLPPKGQYATGLIFLDEETAPIGQERFESCASKIGLKVLAWIHPPTDPSCLGSVALSSQPFIKQVFVVRDNQNNTNDQVNLSPSIDFEEQVFYLR